MRFWNASGVCLNLLYKLSTVRVFLTDADPNENMNPMGEDEWPPLRKVRWPELSFNLLQLRPGISSYKEAVSVCSLCSSDCHLIFCFPALTGWLI